MQPRAPVVGLGFDVADVVAFDPADVVDVPDVVRGKPFTSTPLLPSTSVTRATDVVGSSFAPDTTRATALACDSSPGGYSIVVAAVESVESMVFVLKPSAFSRSPLSPARPTMSVPLRTSTVTLPG